MTRLLRAEIVKLTTVRSYWLLAIGTLVVINGGIALIAAGTSFSPGSSPARATLALAGLAQTVALIAGALAVTGEFRHKTITPAVLITPGRVRILAAKLTTMTLAGLVFGLMATGLAAAIALPVLAGRHIGSGIDGAQLASIIAGGGVATAICAALGVGAGTMIRNQVGAIIALLGLLYVAEPLLGLLPGAGTTVQEYGIGGLVTAATATTGFPASSHLLGQASSTIVLAGYALAALAAGTLLLRQRDISA